MSRKEDLLQMQHSLQLKLKSNEQLIEAYKDDLLMLTNSHASDLKASKQQLTQKYASVLKEKRSQLENLQRTNDELDTEVTTLNENLRSLKNEVGKWQSIEKSDEPKADNKLSCVETLQEISQQIATLINSNDELEQQIANQTAVQLELEEEKQELEVILNEKKNLLEEIKVQLKAKNEEMHNMKKMVEENKVKSVDVDKRGNSVFAEVHDFVNAAEGKTKQMELTVATLREEVNNLEDKLKQLVLRLEKFLIAAREVSQFKHSQEVEIMKLIKDKNSLIDKLMELEQIKAKDQSVYVRSCMEKEDECEYIEAMLLDLKKERDEQEKLVSREQFLTAVQRSKLVEIVQSIGKLKMELQQTKHLYEKRHLDSET